MNIKFFRQWRGCQEGTTAIEFSLLAVPFMFFIVAIIELSLMFVADSLLQGSVNDASRLIRTGQVQQTGGDPQAMFQQALCDSAVALLNCNNFQYDVMPIADFANADLNPVLDVNGNLLNQQFDPGGVSDVILIRVTYRYPLMTPLIGQLFSNYPNNIRLLISTIVLQTEPYDFG